MKIYSIFLLLLFFGFRVFSQQHSLLNLGLGYSLFTGEKESYYEYNLTGFPHITVEKNLDLKINQKDRIRISPGLDFSSFKEHYKMVGLSSESYSDLRNSALSVYSKAAFLVNLKNQRHSKLYAGLLGGVHLISKSKGTKSGMNSIETMPRYFDETINTNGKEFFRPFYYGFFAGFDLKNKKVSRLSPAFELSYFPNLAKTRIDGGIIRFSILIHFYKSNESSSD